MILQYFTIFTIFFTFFTHSFYYILIKYVQHWCILEAFTLTTSNFWMVVYISMKRQPVHLLYEGLIVGYFKFSTNTGNKGYRLIKAYAKD